MTMYRLTTYSIDITEKEVVKTSDASVWYKSKWFAKDIVERELKNTSYHNWFKTFQEAKDWLVTKSERSIKNTELSLRLQKEEFEAIKKLTNQPPKGPKV